MLPSRCSRQKLHSWHSYRPGLFGQMCIMDPRGQVRGKKFSRSNITKCWRSASFVYSIYRHCSYKPNRNTLRKIIKHKVGHSHSNPVTVVNDLDILLPLLTLTTLLLLLLWGVLNLGHLVDDHGSEQIARDVDSSTEAVKEPIDGHDDGVHASHLNIDGSSDHDREDKRSRGDGADTDGGQS